MLQKQLKHAHLSCVSGRSWPFSRYGRMLLSIVSDTPVQVLRLDKEPRQAWAKAARVRGFMKPSSLVR